MSQVEYITLGNQGEFSFPITVAEPAKIKHAVALYTARINAVAQAKGEYICFIDGGEDQLADDFAQSMEMLAKTGKPLGFAAESLHGMSRRELDISFRSFLADHSIIHHGVVVRKDLLLKINWPIGCYSWEVIAYGTLMQLGYAFESVPKYDWRPGPNGARLWPSYTRAIVNSKKFLLGKPGSNFKSDLEIYHGTARVQS